MRVILKGQGYFQGMSRDVDVENEHMVLGVEGRVRQIERKVTIYKY